MIAKASVNRGGDKAQVEKLIGEFARAGLDVNQVWWPSGNTEQDLRCLRALEQWVAAYWALESRKEMEAHGYEFPPVQPDIDPDTDWLRFERWLKREPLNWDLKEEAGQSRLSDCLSDDAVARNWDYFLSRLEEQSVSVDYPEEAPLRIRHDELIRMLRETEFEITGSETTTHITGCEGDCESCAFCTWCDLAEEDAVL
ncbi:MAG: hypothetical protein KDL31_04900 [Kiritimatiellae bacterium]|nr:hypothetical protein [Kiritimatiellia bacterium]